MRVLRVLALTFAAVAVGCLVLATAGMVTGRQSARTGWLLRGIAVASFAATVVLNVAAH